jgi:nitrogen-specific signal transduction histidine kinase
MIKKIPGPEFLTKDLFRLRIFFVLIFLIVSVTIVFFSFRINDLGGFINDFLTTKTEWSLSEHNSFLSMLITEFNRDPDVKKEAERISRPIEEGLRSIKPEIEKIGVSESNKEQEEIPQNIDKLAYEKVQKYLDFKTLEKMTFKELNLEVKKKFVNEDDSSEQKINRIYIESSDKDIVPKSFVFIPSQLVNVNENGEPWLSIYAKREIVFSKIVEKYLLYILDTIPGVEQAYFISLSGFIRICTKKTDKPVENYQNKLSYKKNYADRTYFDSTIKKIFHQSPPYVDTAGFGIVRSYSISILNNNLGIIGIIAVDIKEKPIKSLLGKISLGSTLPWFKNFSLGLFEMKGDELTASKNAKNNLTNEEKILINDFRKKNRDELFTEVQRFESNINRIIYSVPIEKDKIAVVVFDKERVVRNNILFISIIVSVLIILIYLIRYVYLHSIRRIKAEGKQFDLISHMHHSYVITGQSNQIIDHNEEFENLIEEKDLNSKSFEKYLTKDSLKDFKFYLDAGKEKFECPVEIKTKDGKIKQAILISTKTEYPFAEKGSRISIIIESENIESLVAEKYVDRISHLLKSPLHSILGIADQLRRKSAKPRYDEYFRLLDYEINTLSSKISRLLRISRIELEKLEPEYEEFDLTKLVNDIKNGFTPLMAKRKLRFETNITDGVTICADRNMIKAAIENLLENALKYTTIGEISLSLFDTKNEVKIVIKDTGIGIPKNEIDKIFDKKFRGSHPMVQKNDGQGIGLYQVKHFIGLNQGKISVKGVVEEGTEFTVILPKNLEESKEK